LRFSGGGYGGEYIAEVVGEFVVFGTEGAVTTPATYAGVLGDTDLVLVKRI